MINIAIVEDIAKEAQKLEGYCQRYGKEYVMEFQITQFSDALSFLSRQTDYFDIVFMDIMMPGLDGMEAARRLRKTNAHSVLIFVTNMAQFAVQGYEVGAMDFVIKPMTYPHFQMKMKRAVEAARQQSDSIITVAKGSSLWQLSTQDILYLAVEGHALFIHTKDQVVQCWESLSVMEKRLKDKHFLRCNSCYLVNPKHIKNLNGYNILMRDGSELLISHPRRKQFMQELTAYLGEGKL